MCGVHNGILWALQLCWFFFFQLLLNVAVCAFQSAKGLYLWVAAFFAFSFITVPSDLVGPSVSQWVRMSVIAFSIRVTSEVYWDKKKKQKKKQRKTCSISVPWDLFWNAEVNAYVIVYMTFDIFDEFMFHVFLTNPNECDSWIRRQLSLFAAYSNVRSARAVIAVITN